MIGSCPAIFLLALTGCVWVSPSEQHTKIVLATCQERAWYNDADGDGFGNPAAVTRSCDAPEGSVEDGSDCDDSHAAVSQTATEVCNDLDDDCDGTVNDGAIDAPSWHPDADGDGWGDPVASTAACTAPTGTVAAALAQDCDDGAITVAPDAEERCNGVDDDCDGEPDEIGSGGATDAATWYADADEDGYGDAAAAIEACIAPDGAVLSAAEADCDDTRADVSPGAVEVCDGRDDDCDGSTDEGAVDAPTWFTDADGDGRGDASSSVIDCVAPTGTVADATDCDDDNRDVSPDLAEACNGLDDDCDGTVDEPDAADVSAWYEDADGDGWGDPARVVRVCDAPAGTVAASATGRSDCDDTDPAVSPDAPEICDGVDNDCDGALDTDDPDTTDLLTWYTDADGDGYGDEATARRACAAAADEIAAAGDCNDRDAAWNPVASERCDGLDHDCDGQVDEPDALDALIWYTDADADGWGDDTLTTVACADAAGRGPAGTVALAGDCLDGDPAVSPGEAEVCGGGDEDCDGEVDEPGAVGEVTQYLDADGDGYGDAAVGLVTDCPSALGASAIGGDCDDVDADTYPGATERCDGVDQDCDGAEDTVVSFTDDATGLTTDVTSTWAAGSASSPALLTLDTNGRYDLCGGTWYVNLTATATSVRIAGLYPRVGVEDPDTAVLHGGGAGRIVTGTGNIDQALLLERLVLTAGSATGTAGGALYVDSYGRAWVSDCELFDNTADSGGAIYAGSHYASLRVEDSDLHHNDATTAGGALSITYYGGGYSTAVIRDSTLRDNEAIDGGAVACSDAFSLALEGVTLEANRATNGGAVWTSECVVSVIESALTDNEANSYGGAIVTYYGGGVTVQNSTLTGNVSYGSGGAYAHINNRSSGYLWLTDTVVYGNRASSYGGALSGFYGSVILCSGDGAVYGNTDGGADEDVHLWCEAGFVANQLYSDGCDWVGPPGSAYEGLESTIVACDGSMTYATWSGYGADADFACDSDTGCVP